MAVKRIRIYPDPILRVKARVVKRINDDIRQLGTDMVETLLDADGVGLAATQVGVLKRVIAVNLPDEDAYWLVNPEILDASGSRQVVEGCLSMPGYEGLVERSVLVKARALDANGSKWRVTADELLAQVLEHEVDHLNGIMYFDHLAEHERLREVDPQHDESEPHNHDVKYRIRADHSDDLSPLSLERSELLVANADLSTVTGSHSMPDLAYDLTTDATTKSDSEVDSDSRSGQSQ